MENIFLCFNRQVAPEAGLQGGISTFETSFSLFYKQESQSIFEYLIAGLNAENPGCFGTVGMHKRLA